MPHAIANWWTARRARDTRDDLRQVRSRLLDGMLLVFALLGATPTLLSGVNAWRAGDRLFTALALILLLLLIATAALRRRLSLPLKSGLFLSLGWVAAVLVLWRMGLHGAGEELLMTFAVIATIVGSARQNLATWILGTLAIAVFAVLFVQGTLVQGPEVLRINQNPLSWLAALIVFWLISGTLSLAPSVVLDRLDQALTTQQARARELEQSNLALRREIEDRERAEKRFSELARLLPVTVFETDLDGRMTYVNDHSLATFGYTREDFERGVMVRDIIVPQDHPRAFANIDRALRGEETGLTEYGARTRDGRPLQVLVQSAPVLRDGQPVGLRGIVLDVTEQRSLEAQLLQAQKMESVGTLAGGIAHDFNNLLMGIQGHASILELELPAGSPLQTNVARIADVVRTAAHLTGQLLGFARAGKYQPQHTDPAALVQSTLDLFGHAHRGLRLLVDQALDLPTIEVDRVQVQQALLNILVNAAQAAPAEGGQIRVQTRRSSDDENQAGWSHGGVSIVVTDNGAGMTREVQARIFDPFFTTKEPGKGSGLGLASAYGIVHHHGGRILVRSEPGQGSSFSIVLPGSDQPSAEERPRERTTTPGLGTVLVVDDEALVREVTGHLLRRLGYRAHVVSNGEEALAVLEHGGSAMVQAVLLDMLMPGLSGAETLRRLHQQHPALPVIVATGYTGDVQTRELLERGARCLLHKPFTLQELSAALQQALRPRAGS